MSDRLKLEIGRHSDHFQAATKLYYLKAYLFEVLCDTCLFTRAPRD